MDDTVTLREVASREFVGVSESDTVRGTVELLAADGDAAAVVMRGTDAVGSVTPRDVFAFLATGGDPATTRVTEVMSDPPERLSADATVADAVAAFGEDTGWRVVVVDPETGEPIGTVGPRDVVTTGTVERGRPAATGEVGTGTAATAGAETRREPAEDEYATQSICEGCGSLARDLTNVDGQLLCADCRDV
ncbi:MAG: CBS domain-containing protein [Halobacteriaceae archaeon]